MATTAVNLRHTDKQTVDWRVFIKSDPEVLAGKPVIHETPGLLGGSLRR
jgi:uncharacterized protein (DUF433 family)